MVQSRVYQTSLQRRWPAVALWATAGAVLSISAARAQSVVTPSASAAAQPSSPSLAHVPLHPSLIAPPPQAWTAADVQLEQARCTQLLRGLDIVARPASSLRENECGAAAPVELISVGKSPQVTFFPTVTVTCDMAVALHRWLTRDVQPLARMHLDSPVIRVDTMSSYSCRTAYGRKNARLSEHGRANAVDIRSFTTANGGTAEVLADWGPTGPEIAAQVATAKKQDTVKALTASRPAPAGQTLTTGGSFGAVASAPANRGISTGSLPPMAEGLADLTRPTISLGSRGAGTIGIPMPPASGTGFGIITGIGQPVRLGGPKGPDIQGGSATAKTDFLRRAHSTACQVFGTVLGPEANAAHRNHFHVDMAERKLRSICE